MKTGKRKTNPRISHLASRIQHPASGIQHRVSSCIWFYLLSFSLLSLLVAGRDCWAVSTNITRHSSGADLLKGQTQDSIVDSKGTIQLGRAAEVLVEDLKDVWSINSIVVSGGKVFLGTSPNGGVRSNTWRMSIFSR